MRKGDQLAISFQVGDRDPSSSNQLEVDFWITDPHKNQIRSLHRVADGDASVEITESGRYEYCFSNEFSHVGTKDVTFHIHGIVYVDNDNPSPDSLDSQVKILSRLVQEVKNEQGYLVIRERTHRNTAESTNSRVKWWSLFQIIVVAVNSLFQIYYLKRFFEVKTNV
ncbi:Emp24p [Sugiyamaella lignohabitans]|uniref:Emp24p n=1 Tax=Sugiyamaella lignohabitans TaxID=796027 RepID=A0A167CPV4_9ASCO|nr:Emp24p [Sugiyamaella lignohabitans]ANB11965.1 Emp24p [Sugiyamaella lignohabitans]